MLIGRNKLNNFFCRNVTDENLRFLTPDQALADVAHFITHIKQSTVIPGAEDSPVIVIGAHYSGTLAAWFRQKYPHLAIASWASSAPVLAHINHVEYKEIAGAVYRHIGGDVCYDQIESGFAAMEQLVADGNLAELSEIFQLCETLDSENDISTFFALIAEFYSILTQFSQ